MRRYLSELRQPSGVVRHFRAAFHHDVQRRHAACTSASRRCPCCRCCRDRRPASSLRSYIGHAASFPDVITCDMGGTSTDVCLVRGGAFTMTTEGRVARFSDQDAPDRHQHGGRRRRQHRRRGLGRLSHGRSALGQAHSRARPAYGRGGIEPTVTDANVVLGRLGTEQPLGGEIASTVMRRRRLSSELGRESACRRSNGRRHPAHCRRLDGRRRSRKCR